MDGRQRPAGVADRQRIVQPELLAERRQRLGGRGAVTLALEHQVGGIAGRQVAEPEGEQRDPQPDPDEGGQAPAEEEAHPSAGSRPAGRRACGAPGAEANPSSSSRPAATASGGRPSTSTAWLSRAARRLPIRPASRSIAAAASGWAARIRPRTAGAAKYGAKKPRSSASSARASEIMAGVTGKSTITSTPPPPSAA